EIRLPNSFTKLRAALPHVPRVSIATGTNLCAIDRAAYLADFLVSAKAAAAPGSAADRSIYDGAKVSGHVASQSKHLPLDHGTRVAPSGRLASVRAKPGGSRTAAMLALCSARRIVSFNRLVPTCAALARQPVVAELIDGPAADALVRQHDRCTESEPHSDPQRAIVHVEADSSTRDSTQPRTRPWRTRCLQACGRTLIRSLQKSLGRNAANCLVPSPL